MSVLQWELTCEISQSNNRFKPEKLHHCSNIALLIFGKDLFPQWLSLVKQFFWKITNTHKNKKQMVHFLVLIKIKNKWCLFTSSLLAFTLLKGLRWTRIQGRVCLLHCDRELKSSQWLWKLLRGIFLKIHGYPKGFRVSLVGWTICILHLRWHLLILASPTSSAPISLC